MLQSKPTREPRLVPVPPAVEDTLRRVVAERLGVEPAELVADVSLIDDLAADSLDLIDIALVVEAELGVAVPRGLFDEVRTWGELVDAVRELPRRPAGRRTPGARGTPLLVQAALRVGEGATPRKFERALWLTPYGAETLVEDVAHAGPGARLELRVPHGTTETALAWLRHQLAGVEGRGVWLDLRRR
jgi:acyl carrier protein